MVPAGMLAVNVPASEVRSFLAARAVGRSASASTSMSPLKTGDDYVLIDAGSGGTWEHTAGKLADSLEAADIKPEQIGKVVVTHAHPDHIWGLIDELDDSLRFPRAQYAVGAREFDFWTMGEATRLTGPVEGIAAGARRVFKRIEFSSTRIRPGDEVAPGIVAIDTAGHTPGHISLLISSGSDKLLVTADAFQNAHISCAHPDWHPRADMDGEQATRVAARCSTWRRATNYKSFATTSLSWPRTGRTQGFSFHMADRSLMATFATTRRVLARSTIVAVHPRHDRIGVLRTGLRSAESWARTAEVDPEAVPGSGRCRRNNRLTILTEA